VRTAADAVAFLREKAKGTCEGVMPGLEAWMRAQGVVMPRTILAVSAEMLADDIEAEMRRNETATATHCPSGMFSPLGSVGRSDEGW
jgi:hypothetical protein